MADFSNNTITMAGRGLIADALASSLKVQFLRIELGDGEVPEALERVVELGRKVIEFPVSMVSQPTEGACIVTGMFKENTILEGFFVREIGVFARVEGGEEVLLAYAHAGDRADYIPAGSSNSLIEEVFNLTILIGAADVILQDFNANDKATIHFVIEQIKALDVEEIKRDIEKATNDLKELAEELDGAAGNFVKKNGDVMTGALEVPRVKGSCDEWNGWRIFSGFDELNALSSGAAVGGASPVVDIFEKMMIKSRLICNVAEVNDSLPGLGTLDFQKNQDGIVEADFMDVIGRMWRGVLRGGVWSGWFEIASVPVGSAHEFYGTMDKPAPLGYVFMVGQLLLRSDYHRLFSVIGTTYGFTDDTNFRVPDHRGLVARGLDSGRGFDSEPNRVLGSLQGDAVRNLTAKIIGFEGFALSGVGMGRKAFDIDQDSTFPYSAPSTTSTQLPRKNMVVDFSRELPTATEVRVKNIAVNYIMKV